MKEYWKENAFLWQQEANKTLLELNKVRKELKEQASYATGLRQFIREIYEFLPDDVANKRFPKLEAGEILAKPMSEFLDEET
jgi:hypothetical protein